MNGKYSYSPRGRGFNIYLDNPNGGTKVDYVMDEEEARRKVYELNGWTWKPKGYTGEMVQLTNPKGETKSFTADEFDSFLIEVERSNCFKEWADGRISATFDHLGKTVLNKAVIECFLVCKGYRINKIK